MHVVLALSMLALVSFAHSPVGAGQDPHGTRHAHAGAVMGFDQDATVHHFSLFTDGGAIQVTVRRSDDARNRDAIRSHLSRIASMFGSGDFQAPMLVHESANVPGTTVMAERKTAIRYRNTEVQDGARVDIVTSDVEALAAVHAFLTYQIAEHKTGDPVTVRRR